LIPYSTQTITILDAIYVARQVKFRSLTQGSEIQKFEKSISRYVGAKYAVAVSSATAGLHIAHLALGYPLGAKVVTSPISFVASANSIIYAGQTPIFVDVEMDSGNLSAEKLAETLNSQNISTVVPVHFAGNPCDMEKIYELCKAQNISIIEDAAHALGSNYITGEKIGSCKYSDMTVFSFHPVKSITTGEGGVVTTNNPELYAKLLKLRSHGIQKNDLEPSNELLGKTNGIKNLWYYEMDSIGYHYRLTEIQAALGVSQMKKVDKFIKKRRRIALRYDKLISQIKSINSIKKDSRNISANHLFPISIDFTAISRGKNDVMLELRKNGVMTQVHYMPIPLHPFYQNLGYNMEQLPNALNFYFQTLSIPIYPRLSFRKQKKIVKIFKKLF
jgi:UDP-4-amino-4,6-dideoxy-N-acetyl-beta-L-altrosamine transaminase